MTTIAKTREGLAPCQHVEGPEFLGLMISNRSMHRCDTPEHHGLFDIESGVRYIIKRNTYLAYLRTRNVSDQ